jgi:putative tributyrin esterase
MTLPAVVRPIQLRKEGGRLWPAMFKSAALGIRCNVFVYTPPGIDRDARSAARLAKLPVLYLLHGMWGSEIDWPFKGDAQAILDREILAGRVPPMIVAMPHDGLADNGTFYANWFVGRKAKAGDSTPSLGHLRFEDYVINDLRRFVEVELAGKPDSALSDPDASLRDRRNRFVVGLSMGGFGSLILSLRHPDIFCAAASLSGAVRPIGSPRHPELGERIFGPVDRAHRYRSDYDPHLLVERFTENQANRVALCLDCGRSDGLLPMNRKLHAKLNRLGLPHRYVEYAGAHDWPSWRKRLPHVLRFLAGVEA